MLRSKISVYGGCLCLWLGACGPGAPVREASPALPAVGHADEQPARGTVRGRVLDHRGQPLPLARACLHSLNLPASICVDAAADGRFEVAAPPGLVGVAMMGVDHLWMSRTMVLGAGGIELTAQLPTQTLSEPSVPATLMLWRTADGAPEMIDMVSDAEGRRVAEVELPAGEIRYQVSQHVFGGHPTNGTQSDGYAFDGSADYRSLLRVAGGRTTIVFDPRKFPPSGLPGSVEFARPADPAARGSVLIDRVSWMDVALNEMRVAALERSEPLPTAPEGWGAMQDELAAIVKDEPDRDLRRVALMLYFKYPPGSRPEAAALAEMALVEVAPTDPLWTLGEAVMQQAIKAVPDPQRFEKAVVDVAIAQHPDPALGANLLLSRLQVSHKAGDEAAVRDNFAQLNSPRFAGTTGQIYGAMYDPARPLMPGKAMPALELDMLDPGAGEPAKLSLEQLRGRPVLIDLWGTWCKPCVAEMPALHALHAKHGQGPGALVMVSIAVDPPETLRAFRREKWPLPWRQATISNERYEALNKQLGLIGVPVAILLDAEGRVVAATPDLELADVPARLEALAKARKE